MCLCLVGGFLGFLCLEQFLHWDPCHRAVQEHGPLGYLILVADGVHKFIGGRAVAEAFLVDIRVGVVTRIAAAAHEVPQELGDFGILIHAGWSKARALLCNFASADLIPELTGYPEAARKALLRGMFVLGLAVLVAIAVAICHAGCCRWLSSAGRDAGRHGPRCRPR